MSVWLFVWENDTSYPIDWLCFWDFMGIQSQKIVIDEFGVFLDSSGPVET